jgi:tellurite methyltransferase
MFFIERRRKMDKEYWENYYAGQGPTGQPSDFARYIVEKYGGECGHVFDIGCGNGRDSMFFSSQSVSCTGIEQCGVAISTNESKKNELELNVSFQQGDFSTCDYSSLANGEYSIYSRFTLHAINYEEEAELFLHLNNAANLKYLFIEARSISDGIYGDGEKVGLHEYVTTHYRRFIDPQTLKTQLGEYFDIVSFEEGQGFAKTEAEDPCLIRVIAKRR